MVRQLKQSKLFFTGKSKVALTVTVTKQSAEKLNELDYRTKIRVVVTDELDVVLMEKIYSERYYSQLELDTIKAKLQAKFVTDWNKYVAEQNVFTATQFDTMVSELQVAANNYING